MSRDIIDSYLPHVAYKEVPGSSICYEGDALPSPLTPLATSPDCHFYLKVTTSGNDCIGDVTISGTRSDDSSGSEDISFAMCRWKISNYEYKASTALTSITTTNLSDTHLKIEFVDISNNPIDGAASWSEFPCRWDDIKVSYFDNMGAWTLSDAQMICKEEIELTDNVKYAGNEDTPVKIMARSSLEGNELFRIVLF